MAGSHQTNDDIGLFGAEVRGLDPEDKARSTILGERGLVMAVCDGMGGAPRAVQSVR